MGQTGVALEFFDSYSSFIVAYGSNFKIADSEFLPYISIVAFIASECIKRYWESICGESK